MNESKILKIAVQKSGRLSDQSIDLFKKAGFSFEIFNRGLTAKCRNFPLELLFFRADDIPEIVADGTADLGICGQNSAAEKKFDLKEVERLGFGQCRLSIAIPESLSGNFDLQNKKIATSYPNILQKYLDQQQISAEIVELSGSVEIAPKLKIADAVCDLVSSGSTLKMNGLRELEPIFQSEAVLVSNNGFQGTQKKQVEKFLFRIRAVLLGQQYKYILINAPKTALSDIQSVVPGCQSPTVSQLSDPEWISIGTVVQEDIFWETIEKIKASGGRDVLVMPIEKMII